MRRTFFESLIEFGARDPSVWLLTNDYGFTFVERFQEKFPGRFLNCGIAEQAMIGVATGLALVGEKPVCYSIANFYLRAVEQIRNDILHHQANVKLLGIGEPSGGPQGFTHDGEDELAVLSILGMPLFQPLDAKEVRRITPWFLESPGPFYMRLERK